VSEKKSGVKIFPKLLLTMLLISAIPLAGLWYLSAVTGQKTLKDNLDTGLNRVAKAVAADVDGWIDMNIRSLRQSAALEEMASMDPLKQAAGLKANASTYEWTYLLFTTDAEGNNIARSDGNALKFYGDREYFKQVRNGAQVGQQVLIGRSTQKPALCLSVPVNNQIQSFVGVLTGCSQLDAISNAVADVNIGPSGQAFLVDSRGRLVAHSDTDSLSANLQDFSDHPAVAASEASQNVVFEEDGKQVVAYPQTLDLGWTLVVQQDYDDAFAPLYTAKRNALIVMVLTIGLVLAAAFVFTRNLVHPIRQLTNVADAFSRGQPAAEIPGIDRGDEVGELARAVKRMGVSIQMAFDQLKKSHSQAA
jgi:methyl-accepting chemotaxis protein